jgi:hypothetical protein
MKTIHRNIASHVIAGIFGVMLLSEGASFAQSTPPDTKGSDKIRPYKVHIPDAALSDLRKRIAATRWP